MGTDIHLFVETRNQETGKWEARPLPYAGEFADLAKYHDGYRGWSDRNYDVFAMLADVRNGRGFAGVVTGSGFNVIAEPRGIPEDISDRLNPEKQPEENEDDEAEGDEPRRVWLGDHSFSWLLLSEILSFDFAGQTTTKQGVVDAYEFITFQRDGKPYSYSGGVSGQLVRHISNEEMLDYVTQGYVREKITSEAGQWYLCSKDPTREQFRKHDLERLAVAEANYLWWSEKTLARRKAEQPKDFGRYVPSKFDEVGAAFYTSVSWQQTYADRAAHFLKWVDEVLKPLGEKHGVENVRIVFGFDS